MRITIIGVLGVGLILGMGLVIQNINWTKGRSEGRIVIETSKNVYSKDEKIRIVIKNNLKENICFSSCYPFYLERRSSSWEVYPYVECKKKDIITTCINSGKEKIFETVGSPLQWISSGLHRLLIPACVGCKVGDEFRENRKFYSNEFQVK